MNARWPGRPGRRQPPAFSGDFPGDESITEILERVRPADYDGTTYRFTGASGAGLPPDEVYDTSYDAGGWEPDPAAGLRQAIELTAMAERGPATPPTRLRALPPAPAPAPAAQPAPAVLHDDDKIARHLAHGWPHLFEVRCAYPAASHDTPIPCGSVHRDGTALSFRGLRASAWAAGWHLDALGRLACPRCCQDSPEYRTLYPVTVWDPDARDARLARDPDAERDARAAAEHDLFRDVRDTARHGRHATGGAR